MNSELLKQVLEVSRQSAKAAGRLLKARAGIVISLKKQNDFVTNLDYESEKIIISKIKQQFPSHQIISEETLSYQSITDNTCTWVVDPLDGTNNYIHGLPAYSISIGFYIGKNLSFGLIYIPATDEMFYGILDKGAYLNDKPIQVSNTRQYTSALIVATIPPSNLEAKFKGYIDKMQILRKKIAGFRYSGSFALDMAYTAAGRYDLCLSLHSNIWDIAAGQIIIKEAGGNAFSLRNKDPYLFSNTDSSIIAGNQELILNLLNYFDL